MHQYEHSLVFAKGLIQYSSLIFGIFLKNICEGIFQYRIKTRNKHLFLN
ncbi:hypothetical protein L313_0108 [Acinetobacter haemolyticus CIP 64.3 = MTCC 9819]|nr:hypothetical protein L313_0108 [Acinetobacter haemolyticus CIP 64.3 = MTCC 9819]